MQVPEEEEEHEERLTHGDYSKNNAEAWNSAPNQLIHKARDPVQ